MDPRPPSFALFAALVLGGCAPAPPLVEHGTFVQDWRDEVLYQVIVDRFANGDPNNDWNVDEGDLGRYQGGDWRGLADKLDYLQALGITSLWISPAVANVEEDAGFASYHGYWTQAFDQHNPHFGESEALIELINAAHARGMKVILDIVVNHVGQLFYYDINRNGQPDDNIYGGGGSWGGDEGPFDPNTEFELERVSEWDPDWDPRGVQSETSLGESGLAPITFLEVPEIRRLPPEPPEFANADWYNGKGRVVSWNDPAQVVLGDFPGGLKDLKTTLPEVRSALIDVFGAWIEGYGFDGFRIDTLKHVEMSFWPEFTAAMRARALGVGKTNFLMFGEAFDGDDALLGSYTKAASDGGGELDSVFYFSQKFQVFDDVVRSGLPTRKIEDLWAARASRYGTVGHGGGLVDSTGGPVAPTAALINFLDNHDLPRFLWDHDGDGPYVPTQEMLHAALLLLLTMDGIPCLYYGTELDFAGGNDPANRELMWPTGFPTDGATFRWVAALNALRRDLPSLRRGGLQIRWSSPHDSGASESTAAQDAGMFAFERRFEGQTALVVMNLGDEATSETSASSAGGGDMIVGFPPGTVLEDRLGSGLTVTVGGAGPEGTVRISLPPRQGVVLTEG